MYKKNKILWTITNSKYTDKDNTILPTSFKTKTSSHSFASIPHKQNEQKNTQLNRTSNKVSERNHSILSENATFARLRKTSRFSIEIFTLSFSNFAFFAQWTVFLSLLSYLLFEERWITRVSKMVNSPRDFLYCADRFDTMNPLYAQFFIPKCI